MKKREFDLHELADIFADRYDHLGGEDITSFGRLEDTIRVDMYCPADDHYHRPSISRKYEIPIEIFFGPDDEFYNWANKDFKIREQEKQDKIDKEAAEYEKYKEQIEKNQLKRLKEKYE